MILLGAACGVSVVWQGWDRGVAYYQRWKQKHALEQARDFIAKRDAPNAQLALEVALKAIPGNPDTIRVAADMLEQVSAPQAMRLRRAVVQIESDSAEDTAKLVLCCIRFRDFNAAKDALSTASPAVAAQPAMLRAALSFALATQDWPVADVLFSQLKSQFPNDAELKFAQAVLHLRHPREDIRATARRELETLARTDRRLSLPIDREFVSIALQNQDYVEAEHRLQLVVANPAATLVDRLQQANLQLLVNHQPFDPIYAALAPLAARSEADAVQFVQWLLVQNRSDLAGRWLQTLPDELRNRAAIKSVHADVASQAKDWDRLADLLEAGAWGPISKETLRLAFAAQTVDNPAHPALRRGTWEMTLASAGGNLLSLRALQRLASVWQWQEESEQALWTIARSFPDQTWAHQALFNAYRERKDTNGMRDIMGTLRNADGSVARYQHDWALLTLLTEPTASWNPAKETMAQLHQADPANSTYATSYAFALAQAGRAAAALAVIEKLTPGERQYPPRQPFLAFVYGVNKRPDDVARAIDLGQQVNFLPEETYLFTRAREELARKPEKPRPNPPAASARADALPR